MSDTAEIDERADALLERVTMLVVRINRFKSNGEEQVTQIREEAAEVGERARSLVDELRQANDTLIDLLGESSQWIFESENFLAEMSADIEASGARLESDGANAHAKSQKLIASLDHDATEVTGRIEQEIVRLRSGFDSAVRATHDACVKGASAFSNAILRDVQALHQKVDAVNEDLDRAAVSLCKAIDHQSQALEFELNGSFVRMREGSTQIASNVESAVLQTVKSLESSVTGSVRDIQLACSTVSETCTQLAELSKGASEAVESTNQGMQVAADLVQKIKRIAEEIEDAFHG